MQRKKTNPLPQGADLPDLTPQQMKFVEGILAGKRITEAFRAAYDCSTMQPDTVWACASRLNAHSKISAWLSAARMAGLGDTTCTLEGHLAELERLKNIAIETGNVGAAVQAEQLRGKVKGHYIERIDVTQHNPQDLELELADILGTDQAQQLAQQWASESTKH